ncbi:phosphatidylinositol 4,5-bisphosphate 3-kinase catalytic subunit beta isoform-like [Anneissia japonica]|uniref:phosphatidylinositol 4,5-bisphosphate 3-kinase catalytic subunit beta isoform-like n=1 Tax=Anneissia japonica TaxID=1529436 RepID=UPI0014258DC9|nr:phosphatidylinositol 4,5-bisphosphate 3-kinase catalytic subunit beta isoform-like [Anneissia japonica]
MPPGGFLSGDIWTQGGQLGDIMLDCLMPTGVLVQLKCARDATITQIKRELWQEASKFPLFNKLHDLNFYVFQCINQNAEREELLDEKRRICDVMPFCPMLQVVRKAGDLEEKLLNSKIGMLIGKALYEFDAMKNPEVNDFRTKMKQMVLNIQKKRNNWDWMKKAQYLYPPQLEVSMEIPEHLRDHFPNDECIVNVKYSNEVAKDANHTHLRVGAFEWPIKLVEQALKRPIRVDLDPEDCLLKVIGYDEFIMGEYPISQFKTIRRARSKGVPPQLILIKKSELKVEELFDQPMIKGLSKCEVKAPPIPKKIRTLSWDVEAPVKITIEKAVNVNVAEKVQVRVKAGIFHGDDLLCNYETTEDSRPGKFSSDWEHTMQFDIRVCDLPRMARLCILLYTPWDRRLGKSAKKKKQNERREIIPVAWANSTFFDYNSQLKMDSVRLRMWPASEDVDLNPLGTIESNPSVDATSLTITFYRYQEQPISYPPFEKVLEYAANIAKEEQHLHPEQITDQQLEELKQVVERDPLEPLTEQECRQVWMSRQDCRDHIPHSLPRLIKCVRWNSRSDVAQMQALLQIWPRLEPEEALLLLDYNFADMMVRNFAVECLNRLTDDQLSQYLLQVVQAIKYESHLDCELCRFLLKRALANQRIGHFLFWHLRAEMHHLNVSTRFGLMLEAYCWGSVAHMDSLHRQVESLNKLKSVNELVKSRQFARNPEEALQMMKTVLKQDSYMEVLSSFSSPIQPEFKLKCLKLDDCKFMTSKMRPLWLVFENEDAHGNDIMLMFKNGDDLRQDMLTLQVIQIMDNLWQAEGLDLKVIPYKTLSTGHKVGVIEIVQQASTIAQVQKMYARRIGATFRKASLYQWLKDQNSVPNNFEEAIVNFTSSCAGYCVATYVLGIGDRHNDNIMVKQNGQLFHVDFGHFLGKFKCKFGVKRERVPFVLATDFVYVITRGKQYSRNDEFGKFRKCCEDAYLVLRRQGKLLISLFAMMLSSGIPELTAETLTYLRDTLLLDKSEEEALRHFKMKFDESLKNSWKTSVNWWAHVMAH